MALSTVLVEYSSSLGCSTNMLVQTSFPATYVHSLLRLMYGKPSSILRLWEREERGLEVIGFPLLPPPKSFHSSQHDPTERKKPVTVLHFGIKKCTYLLRLNLLHVYVLLITVPILYLFCPFAEALVWQQQNHFEGCITFHEIGRGEGENIAMGFLPLECIFGGPHQDPPPPLSPISRHISFPFFFHFLCGRRKERNEAGKRARGEEKEEEEAAISLPRGGGRSAWWRRRRRRSFPAAFACWKEGCGQKRNRRLITPAMLEITAA